MDERAHRLIDRIYAAALDREVWQQVAEGFSGFFDDSLVLFGFSVPGDPSGPPHYAVGIEPEWRDCYMEHFLNGLPWSTRYVRDLIDRFGHLGESLGHVELAETPFYKSWMEPQGIAPCWQVGHTVASPQGDPAGGLAVMRRLGQEPISRERIAEADVFVPHLRRAVEIQFTLNGAQRVRLALAEAVDRLPTGLVLLDARRRVVIQNRGAERIAEQRDGLRIDPQHGPSADDARQNATLQRLLADALEASERRELGAPGFLGLSRPSGERPYALMVTPLIADPTDLVGGGAVVAIFIADPTARIPAGSEVLEELYDFTHSEAELVRLLSTGMSLEEAAGERGVSLNTARSHLKHAFAKTGTSRQGELVRLIVTGVGQIRGR